MDNSVDEFETAIEGLSAQFDRQTRVAIRELCENHHVAEYAEISSRGSNLEVTTLSDADRVGAERAINAMGYRMLGEAWGNADHTREFVFHSLALRVAGNIFAKVMVCEVHRSTDGSFVGVGEPRPDGDEWVELVRDATTAVLVLSSSPYTAGTAASTSVTMH